MKFKISSELQYEVRIPTTFIFNIQVARSSSHDILEERLVTDPAFKLEEFTVANGDARFIKLEAANKANFRINYDATVDLHYNVIDQQRLLETVPVVKLDGNVIPY